MGTSGNWVNADRCRAGKVTALGEDERAELARLRKAPFLLAQAGVAAGKLPRRAEVLGVPIFQDFSGVLSPGCHMPAASRPPMCRRKRLSVFAGHA